MRPSPKGVAVWYTRGARRLPAGTFVEQGVDYTVEAWFAVVGPKGLPAAEVQRVHAAVSNAFADPAVKEVMARQGNVIAVQPADKAMGFFRSEMQRFAQLVKKAGVEPQ